jgi:hypothetical protein
MQGFLKAVPVPTAPNAPSMVPPSSTSNAANTSTSSTYQYPSFSRRIRDLDQRQIQQLKSQGYTQGLMDVLAQTTQYFPLRIWVVDNSGSMNQNDGNRLVSTKNSKHVKLVQCTRWAEIQETINYHAQMAALIEAPTTFRLLNAPGAHVGPQEFSVADKGHDFIENDLQVARRTITNASPSGVTPLVRHLRDIRDTALAWMDDLNGQGKKIAIILATDGLPTDDRGVCGSQQNQEFVEALRSMEGLPVWIVIRLCTDEDKIVDFYNNLDEQLELSIEVLDDFTGEANEVFEHNPWLNYTLCLHRMREMGLPHRLFDLLDERPFTRTELRDFCFLLFGAGSFDGVPEPELDFKGFLKALYDIMSKEQAQYDPVRKKVMPIMNLKELNRIYGDSSSCTIM